ncbi:MAG: zinc-binding alcohol dehydrogenase family protein [Chloroflexi bacterium CFX7]|nr:zinc-binding alcohol dehydrogenase family protein [Chloroflexi bacterium CFX7]RIL02630.1 MAG: alcohol dehydrogenase [bacterium]
MRAAVLERSGPISQTPLSLREVPSPVPGPGELALRVAACGICRTDLQLAEGDLPPRRLPIIPGHQVVGTVAAIGAGVEGWLVGERAGIAWLGGACGSCSHCLAGQENLCLDARFTGWDRDGGFAEAVTVNAGFALRIPGSFADVAAAPLLCGGVIGYRSLKVSGIKPGGRLGLYGFGASALLTIQVAVYWGCEVFVCTRSKGEQSRALALGASWAGGYDDRPPSPLDAAITFAPVGDVVVNALKALDRGGTVAINAIHLDRVPEFGYEHLWWERQLRSVANFTRNDAGEFLRLAAEIPVRTEFETSPLHEANSALARLARGEVRGAVVLTM